MDFAFHFWPQNQQNCDCVFIKCGGPYCKKKVFAHMRVDDPYRPPPSGSQEIGHLFFNRTKDKGSARNTYQWKPNPDCKKY